MNTTCESNPTVVGYNSGRPTEIDCPSGLPATGADLLLLACAAVIAIAAGTCIRISKRAARGA